MLEATRRVVEEGRPHAGLELLFTPKEEVGLRRRLRVRPHAASRADRATSTTRRRRSARSSSARRPRSAIEATFHGRAAHAGMYPEEGRSAIAAAARAIADMRLGRIDEETSANVGVIDGRHGAQHRPRALLVPRRGTQPRRGEARRARARDDGDDDASRPRSRSARSRRRSTAATARTGSGRATRSVRLAATALERTGHDADVRAERRRRRRERVQRARPRVRQPRERHDRDPHTGRAHRGRRPRRDGRRDPGPAGRGPRAARPEPAVPLASRSAAKPQPGGESHPPPASSVPAKVRTCVTRGRDKSVTSSSPAGLRARRARR